MPETTTTTTAAAQSTFQQQSHHHHHEPANKKAPPPPINGGPSLSFPSRPSLTSPSSLTEELSQAAKEIVNASHKLEKEFAEMAEPDDDPFNNEE